MMPSVLVVPLYVEVPGGFERAVSTLESILQRAGYRFHTGEPMFGTLEDAKQSIEGAPTTCEAPDGTVRTGISS
jgi:hypothetical protein